MAMGLLAHHLAERGMEARVHSAGTLGWGGPATAHAVETLAARGIDLSAHESRRMSATDVDGADLVLGMTRDHVLGTLNRDPEARDRTFVIGELARLGRVHGPRRHGQSVRDWCTEVAATRPSGTSWARSIDEIADPVGEGLDVYRATADRLDALCAEIAALLLPRGAHGETVDIDAVDAVDAVDS